MCAPNRGLPTNGGLQFRARVGQNLCKLLFIILLFFTLAIQCMARVWHTLYGQLTAIGNWEGISPGRGKNSKTQKSIPLKLSFDWRLKNPVSSSGLFVRLLARFPRALQSDRFGCPACSHINGSSVQGLPVDSVQPVCTVYTHTR